MTVLQAPPGGSIPGPGAVCAGCSVPLSMDYAVNCGAFCLRCLAQIDGTAALSQPPVLDTILRCQEPGCPWEVIEGADWNEEELDRLRFRAEEHNRTTGHLVAIWYYGPGDDADEVIDG